MQVGGEAEDTVAKPPSAAIVQNSAASTLLEPFTGTSPSGLQGPLTFGIFAEKRSPQKGAPIQSGRGAGYLGPMTMF
jgi:hypothetical protein